MAPPALLGRRSAVAFSWALRAARHTSSARTHALEPALHPPDTRPAERLKVWMLPTLAVIKHEKTTDYVVGLDELGGVEDFPTGALAARRCSQGVVQACSGGAAAAAAAQPLLLSGNAGPVRAARCGLATPCASPLLLP